MPSDSKLGTFVTFEGGDGAGKSEQIIRIADRLRSQGADVVCTREPGGTEKGEQIREALLSGSISEIEPQVEFLMFLSARIEHMEKKIIPALQRGSFVLCDRFIDSTRVYQGAIGGVDEELISRMEHAFVAPYWPNATFLLDVDPETARNRLTSRRLKDGGVDSQNPYDDWSLEQCREIRSAYLSLARNHPERIHLIGELGSIEAIHQVIWQILSRLFVVPHESEPLRCSG